MEDIAVAIRKVIRTPDAPRAIGPYSQAIEVTFQPGDRLVSLSGQISLTADGKDLSEEPINRQTVQVLKNLEAVLRAAGATLANVIKARIFLVCGPNDELYAEAYATVNKTYDEFFNGVEPPSRVVVGVAWIPRGGRVEIEVDAIIPQEKPLTGEKGE